MGSPILPLPPALSSQLAALPPLPVRSGLDGGDWLVPPGDLAGLYRAGLYRSGTDEAPELVATNGLISRTWRLAPNAATVALDNLMTGESLLRGVKPEATVSLDGDTRPVGGLIGQVEYGYLRREWLEEMAADPAAFRLRGFDTGPTQAPFSWEGRRGSAAELPWPAPGIRLDLHFSPPPAETNADLGVSVHYELYDGMPLLCTWLTIRNDSGATVRLDTFVNEILAIVDYEACVDEQDHWEHPAIHVESDYAFHGMTARSADVTTQWVPDPQYTSQVNYQLQSPVLLESRPPRGPDVDIPPGETLSSFRTFLLLHDSTERERRGLAVRRMYRTISPWVAENPILMHVRHADDESVKTAVDQCAEVGFEMVILTFGSGFDAEDGSAANIERLRSLADYAHANGVELGGYSLLASRTISVEVDVINPATGAPGDAVFGNSPCLGSDWGADYFRKLKEIFEQTGLDILEHDGSYPGDLCASQHHPGHRGLDDSQWTQWKVITEFYQWCRGRGIYLNVPDWYFLSGSSKSGMGYREVNWSLPRDRQLVLGRQNIYDGTWDKTPSMGWMFVPLVEYHGGGEEATLEPLCEHLDAYEAHLAQNLGAGVQACYRGPRLYDTEETKAVVKRWVEFYKKHRAILESDVIHVRRADARDLDCVLHVNSQLHLHRGLAMVYNPLDSAIDRTVTLPLYYTGISDVARIGEQELPPREYRLSREYNVDLRVELPARGRTWFVIESADVKTAS